MPPVAVNFLNQYRIKYDTRNFKKIPCHITLISPFELKGDLNVLISDISNMALSEKVFKMQLDGFGMFGNEVFYVRPNCPKQLRKLQGELKNYIGLNYRKETDDDYWKFDRYNPHITIVSGSKDAVKKAALELQNINFACMKKMTISGIDLYVKKYKGWILHTTFSFGGLD